MRGDRPFYSGWISGALPGLVHALKAARIWGIVAALADAGLLVLADRATSAQASITTPYKGPQQA